MKTSPVLVLLCVWAAHAHALALKGQSLERSPASVRVSAARSSRAPRHLQVEAFSERHSLRLQPAAAPFAEGFKLQTTSRDEQGRFIIEDVVLNKDDDNDLYEDVEAGSVVQVTAAGVEGFISPSLALNTTADGQHEAVRKNYEAKSARRTHDYLHVPEEPRSRVGGNSRVTRNAQDVATVEMFVVVDTALADEIGSDDEILNYMLDFWESVNQRFAMIEDPKIKVVLTGYMVMPSDETFISENSFLSNFIHEDNTLDSLSKWAYASRDWLLPHDMLYFMTGKDMALSEENTSTSGKGYVGGACYVSSYRERSYNVAMGEANPLYTGVMTAVHEVAHNLGAKHDGDEGAESCSFDAGFIMSYVPNNSENNESFSPCSKRQMKQYLSRRRAHCLYRSKD